MPRMLRRFFLFVLVFAGLAGAASAAITSSFAGGVFSVGTNAGDPITLGCTGAGGNVLVNGANPASGVVACAAVTQIVVNGGAAGDTFDLSAVNVSGFTALPSVTVDSGDGADTIQGSALADVVIAGPGADTVTGNQGSDTVFLGEGDDIALWDPGDGNDVIEGQGSTDELQFNGSNANETIFISANGGRALMTRDVGSIVMDTDAVERIRFNAVRGTDTVNVQPLTGTDITQVLLDFAVTLGGAEGDLQSDRVVVNGGPAPDAIGAGFAGGEVSIVADATTITLAHVEPTFDQLTLNGLEGNDTLTVDVALAGQLALIGVDGGADTDTLAVRGSGSADAIVADATTPFVAVAGVPLIHAMVVENLRLQGRGGNDSLSAVGNVAPLFALTLDGGANDDILLGGNGADVLLGGDGEDLIEGNQGSDVIQGGADNDVFQWDPGDGSDVIAGQGGSDVLRFNGSAANEVIHLVPDGSGVQLTRNVGNITLDMTEVEQFDISALNGTDTLEIGTLAGTDATSVLLRLAGTIGGDAGDVLADTVIYNASASADNLDVSVMAGDVVLTQAALTLAIRTAEPTLDRLVVNGGDGDDAFLLAPVAATLIGVTLDGGGQASANGDVVAIAGDAAAEAYQIVPEAGSVVLTRSTPSALSVAIHAAEWLELDLAGGADTVQTTGLPGTGQILDGGTPGTIPGDTLGITGFNGDIFESPIQLVGAGPIVHRNFEQTSNSRVFEAFLFGAQEVPRNPSTGTGFGTVTLNPAQNAITAFLDYAGLAGNSTLVHIHGPARRGVVAPPIIDLPVSGLTSGSFVVGPLAVTPAQVTDLKAGLWYFNVHSTAPGSAAGEVRGQIDGRQFVDGFE